MTLAEQLKMFYDGKMASSDAFYFGETPAVLEIAGMDTLPLAFTQADFKKSTRGKHNVPRRVLKRLSNDLETALFAFGSGNRVGILTSDIDGDGKPLLVGIQTAAQMDAGKVNVIRSVYGLDNPSVWLKNQIESGKTFHLLDEKRTNTFLYPYGYLASRKEGISSMAESIAQNGTEVKPKFSLKTDSEGRQLTEAQEEYFKDSKVRDKNGVLLTVYHQTERKAPRARGVPERADTQKPRSYHGQGFREQDGKSPCEGLRRSPFCFFQNSYQAVSNPMLSNPR